MTTGDWTAVASAAEVAGPPWPCVDVDGVAVQLVRDGDGRIHALAASCPHLDAPMNQAVVEDGTVACNRHFYTYRLADGANVAPGRDRAPIAVHEVRVEAGTVHVRLAPGDDAGGAPT